MEEKILEMLNENNDIQIQEKGIELAKEIKDISLFMLPSMTSAIWKNCAKVIESKSDEELKPYILDLLVWIQDINRSGAFRIYFRLKDMDVNILYPDYIKVVEKCILENDDIWLDWLSGLIERESLKDKLPIHLYRILKEHNTIFWQGNSELYRKFMEENDL